MKKVILLAAVASLVACNKKTEETAAADAATPTATVAAGKSIMPPGTYTVTDDKGTVGTTIINADGTYIDRLPDGKEVKGTIAAKNGMDCFDPDGDEAETCFSMTAPEADGTFKATSADGKATVTVTPAKS
jgi:uncharacterized lipoprotein NlpE involved in copper resistance